MSDHKTCTRCGVEKPLTEFHRNKNTKDGLQYKCKGCAIADFQVWNADRLERKRAAREQARRCRYVACDEDRYNKDYCLTHFSLLPDGLCVECGSLTKHPDGWCLHCRVDKKPRPDGYVRVKWQGRDVGLHRIVMEEALGRPLFPDENVHHINGDRADNRLENLELWSTVQPSGQRVRDKVEWAQMILTRYGHLESSPTTRA